MGPVDTDSEHPAAGGPASVAPPRAGRRVAIGAAVLLASMALHLAALLWLGSEIPWPQHDRDAPPKPVAFALILPAASGEVKAAAPKPAPAPRPKPRPPAPPVPDATASAAPIGLAPPSPTPEETPAGPAADVDVGTGGPGDRADAEDLPAPQAEVDAGAAASQPPAAAPSASTPLYGAPLASPPVGSWRFRVFYGDYAENRPVASLDYSIQHDGERYRMRTEGRAEGLTALIYSGVLTQSSVGRVTQDGLQPERYTEQRGKRAERWAAVDYAQREVSFSGGERVPLVDGAQDRLSVLLQLSLLARTQPERFAAGRMVEMNEMSLRDIERARYESLGDEVLETERGALRTVHLARREPRREGDPSIEVWLGYDHHFVPVRIRITDVGGRVLDQLFWP